MQHPPATQRRVKGEAGERPERQLDDVVVEFRGGEMQVVLAVDDQQRNERAYRPDQRSRHRPQRGKGGDHRDLRERIEEHVAAEQP